MKVAVLSPAAELGGAEQSLLTFLKAAHGRTLEAVVLLPRPGPLGQALSRVQVPWEVAPMPPALLRLSRQQRDLQPTWMVKQGWGGLLYLARLRRRLAQLNPEILYTNGIKAHVLGALLRPLGRARLVWHVRDFWEGRYVGPLADWGPHLIIANSRAAARHLQSRMGKPHKVRVVHNAVDLDDFHPQGPQAPCPPFRHRVGLVAALARLKGHTLLLRAAPLILKACPETGFFFIGDEIYDSIGDRGYGRELARLASTLGLGAQVVFTGFQDPAAPWYRAMDVVVNASLVPEGFGRTLLEAMACGRAVVGPEAGGVPEFLRSGDNGLLYEPGNPQSLAAAVVALLRDPSRRQRLGAAGRETAVRRFAAPDHAAAMLRVLQEAAA